MWKKNPCLTPILAGRDKCCSLVTLFVSQPLRAKRLREKQQVPHPADNSNLSHPTPLVIPTEAYPDFSNASWQATRGTIPAVSNRYIVRTLTRQQNLWG
jgi:hypothetical protein